jgi:adenylosuccinate synthase
MNEKKLFTITDLGGGDGGKGGVVHKVCCVKHAHTVLKVGGAQGSHGVRTERGQRFNFSQFGCGTFEGVNTHITKLMVVEPLRLMREAQMLATEWRIDGIFDYLTVDEECLCVTPFHTIASRLRELARKDKPKGTIGVGVGEAALDAELYPDLAIHVKDIGRPDLADRLEAVRVMKLRELSEIVEHVAGLWPQDRARAVREIELLQDPAYAVWSAQQFQDMAAKAAIVGTDYLEKEVLSKDGVVVVESSHGILTDKYHGFHPHTSRLRTIPAATFELLKERGYDGEVVSLGVTRAYQIRHGAGPMVTESPEMASDLLPGSNKDENRWQGKVRVGPLDLVALRYAIEVCGGPATFAGLAVTWFDQIQRFGRWDVCNRYIGADDSAYFSPSGEMLVRRGTDLDQLMYQETIGKKLGACRPEIASYHVPPDASRESLSELCSAVLKEKLGVPVRMISFGPTEAGKECL